MTEAELNAAVDAIVQRSREAERRVHDLVAGVEALRRELWVLGVEVDLLRTVGP